MVNSDLMLNELKAWLSPIATEDELDGQREKLELLVDAELRVEKGDFSGGMAFYSRFSKDEIFFLPAARCALLMAIGSREKYFFNLLRKDIDQYSIWCSRPNAELGVNLLLSWLHLILHVKSAVPQWVESIDFSNLPSAWQPIAAYLKVLSCLNTGDFHSGYVVGKLLLELKFFHQASFLLNLYLKRACAELCRDLGRMEESRRWFGEMALLACDGGWVRPFLGLSFGSRSSATKILVENAPMFRKTVKRLSKKYLQSLVFFHNLLVSGNVAEGLTPREFYVAMALKRGCSYKEIARNMEVSIGRVNILVRFIYQQLGVHSRVALEPLVW